MNSIITTTLKYIYIQPEKQEKLSKIKPIETFPAAFLGLVPVEYTVVLSIERQTSYCILEGKVSLHNIHISYTVNN